MDLTPAAPDLDAAKPVLLDPEFHRQTGIYPLCLVSLALISVFFYSWCLPLCSHSDSYLPILSPRLGIKASLLIVPLPPTPGQVSLGPGTAALWYSDQLSLPAIHYNIIKILRGWLRLLQKYAWSTEMEEFLCPWEKKTRTYLLDFMGILVTIFHMKLLTTARKTTITRSYVLSGKYHL